VRKPVAQVNFLVGLFVGNEVKGTLWSLVLVISLTVLVKVPADGDMSLLDGFIVVVSCQSWLNPSLIAGTTAVGPLLASGGINDLGTS